MKIWLKVIHYPYLYLLYFNPPSYSINFLLIKKKLVKKKRSNEIWETWSINYFEGKCLVYISYKCIHLKRKRKEERYDRYNILMILNECMKFKGLYLSSLYSSFIIVVLIIISSCVLLLFVLHFFFIYYLVQSKTKLAGALKMTNTTN